MKPLSLVRSAAALVAVVLFFAPSASAQSPCPAVGIQAYGQGCAPVFPGQAPALKGTLDNGACLLTLAWSSFPGCCNTFLTDHFLFVGLQQAQIPAPPPWIGCTLLVQPLAVFAFPGAVDQVTVFVPPLPPGVSATAFFQIVDRYVTFGVQQDFQFSNGLAVKVSG